MWTWHPINSILLVEKDCNLSITGFISGAQLNIRCNYMHTHLCHSHNPCTENKNTCSNLKMRKPQVQVSPETVMHSLHIRYSDVLLVVSENLRKIKKNENLQKKVEFPGFPWVIIRPKGLRVMKREFCVFLSPGSKALKYTSIVMVTTSKTHNPLWGPNISFTLYIL